MANFYLTNEGREKVKKIYGDNPQIFQDYIDMLERNGKDITGDTRFNQYIVPKKNIEEKLSQIPKDINKLSKTEIKNKIGLLEELGAIREGSTKLDEQGIRDYVLKVYRDVKGHEREDVETNNVNLIINSLKKNGSFPRANELSGVVDANAKIINKLQEGNIIGEFTVKKDILSPENVDTLGELKTRLNEIQNKEIKEGKISSFIETELPQRGEEAVSGLEEALQKSQGEFFQQSITPSVIRELSARGLLRGGDLSSALSEQAGRLQTGIQQTIAPLRFEAKQAPTRLKYENLLRQALESGQDLTSAIGFTRNLFQEDLARRFQGQQSELNRQSQQEIARQNFAMQLAEMSGQTQGPSGFQQFLQYGLPLIGQVATAGSGSIAGRGLSFLGGVLSNLGRSNRSGSSYKPYNSYPDSSDIG